MLARLARVVNRGFVVVVLSAALAGYARPSWFGWMGRSVDVPGIGSVSGVLLGLSLIMFGMGMTLSWEEVRRSLGHPVRIVQGVLLQYGIMPLAAFLLAFVLDLPDLMAAGVILVGCCPGGTASNVIAYLADADVPYSVSVTLGSTLVAPLATPWLTWLYAQELWGFYRGGSIEVPVWLLMTAVTVVVVPILVGLVLKRGLWADSELPSLDHVFTLLAILIISTIVAYVVGRARAGDQLQFGVLLVLPVILHNLIGLGSGYLFGVLQGWPRITARSLSIEVGMQNSGLAVALAGLLENRMIQLGYSPEALILLAVPGVLFSVWHNISGPLLASWWSGAGSSNRG